MGWPPLLIKPKNFRAGIFELSKIKLTHNWLTRQLLDNIARPHFRNLQGIVLDLGCGLRPYEREILNYSEFYYGVDWNNTLHDLRADIIANLDNSLPILDGAVDHVVSFEVLEHLCEPDIMLIEAFRILRCGGTLFLSTPFQWWIHEAPWDFQRFTSYGLEYHLKKAGFVDIHVQPTSGVWAMWVLKFNYQTNRVVRGPWWWRLSTRALLIPIWWISQTIAPAIDKIWPEDRETAGYFVTARKP